MPKSAEPVDRGAEADDLGDRRRPRLEARRRRGPADLVERHAGDHVAAADQRLGVEQQVVAAVQDADAGRAVGLVAGPGVEVGVQRRQVDRHLRHGLGAVDDGDDAGRARAPHDLGDRVDRPDDVGDVRDREQLGARQQPVERVEVEQALGVERHLDELGARLARQHPPRHEVGVVLHPRDEDAVAGADVAAAPAVGDDVQRLGRVAREDRVARGPVDERGDARARALEEVGRLRRPAGRSPRCTDARWWR